MSSQLAILEFCFWTQLHALLEFRAWAKDGSTWSLLACQLIIVLCTWLSVIALKIHLQGKIHKSFKGFSIGTFPDTMMVIVWWLVFHLASQIWGPSLLSTLLLFFRIHIFLPCYLRKWFCGYPESFFFCFCFCQVSCYFDGLRIKSWEESCV